MRWPPPGAARTCGADVDGQRFAGHADRINALVRDQAGRDPRAVLADAGIGLTDCEDRLAGLVEAARAAAGREGYEASREREQAGSDLGHVNTAGDEATADQARGDADVHLDRAAAAEDAQVDRADAAAYAAGEADYDTAVRRGATETALRDAGVPDQALAARMTTDRLNGQHPHTAAQRRRTPVEGSKARARGRGRNRDAGLER